MMKRTLDGIVTPQALKSAAREIESRAVGLDRETLQDYLSDPAKFEKLSAELVEGRYTPMPLERVEIPKGRGETRPIGISVVRDKIVQKTLAKALTEYFDPLFSERSFGYRPGRGTLAAIDRCRETISKGYGLVYRSDIDDFFERIEHKRLLRMLGEHIGDRKLLRVISLFLANGSFRRFDYLEHGEGVHQGDALSPILSNIYLDAMDKWLEKHHVEFVRFADDFTLFFKHRNTREAVVPKLADWLYRELALELEPSKSYEASVWNEGFTFLGVRFHRRKVLIDEERLEKKIARFYEMADASWTLETYLGELEEFVDGLRRYYLKILGGDTPQFARLEHAFRESIARRLARAFGDGTLRYKKEARSLLEPLEPLRSLGRMEWRHIVDTILDRAKSLAGSTANGAKRHESVKRALGRKRQEVARRLADESVVLVDAYGSYLGISKRRIVHRHKGKVLHSLPIDSCRRIIVQTKGASLSAALIETCARRGIALDFIDGKNRPAATLYTLKQSYASMALKQLERRADPEGTLRLARAFLKAKLKNQRNYLKYLDKHHHDVTVHVERLATVAEGLKSAGSVEELMGVEGSASALYWDGLSRIVAERVAFESRVTRGATDPVNSALNYAYAILYGEVQRALIKAGLALHISYLHALDGAKPTLVFDLIEEFRTFCVDRTVFSMINREEPIRVDGEGKLKKSSRRLIAQNVLERLGSFTRYRKESRRLSLVIEEQAYRLARAIEGGKRYRGFVGRY
jgi:group II intron reverse transcriptase/maturase/CRISPR-associated endonuclease Cas1